MRRGSSEVGQPYLPGARCEVIVLTNWLIEAAVQSCVWPLRNLRPTRDRSRIDHQGVPVRASPTHIYVCAIDLHWVKALRPHMSPLGSTPLGMLRSRASYFDDVTQPSAAPL
jgi:hypothetical protein